MTTVVAPAGRAGFLSDAELDDEVERLYAADLDGQGYVSNLTRVWAHSPEALAVLSYLLKRSTEGAGLDQRQRAVLVAASAATWATRTARSPGEPGSPRSRATRRRRALAGRL